MSTQLEKWKSEAREILTNVEFLHGVPVQAPEKTLNEIDTLITQIATQSAEAERERIIPLIAPFMSNRPLDENDLQKLYPDQIRKFLTPTTS